MDVSNGTGSNSDYKVTSSGGTRGPGWHKLPKHSRIRHDVDASDGPWKIEFKVTGANGGEVKVSSHLNDPDALVVLVEKGGSYAVDVKTNGH